MLVHLESTLAKGPCRILDVVELQDGAGCNLIVLRSFSEQNTCLNKMTLKGVLGNLLIVPLIGF